MLATNHTQVSWPPVMADARAPGELHLALAGSRIPGLDFLRAISVLLVLLAHSGAVDGFPMISGGLGVEIFFVLSGFLITWMLIAELDATKGIDILAFYRRRAARLLPVFWLYMTL